MRCLFLNAKNIHSTYINEIRAIQIAADNPQFSTFENGFLNRNGGRGQRPTMFIPTLENLI